MQPFDHPRHLKSTVPPGTRLWWDSARVCLYYINDNDNGGARFYSKSNANNSIVNYAVLLFISTLTVLKLNDCVKLICRYSK